MKAYPAFLIVLMYSLLSGCSKSTDKRNTFWYDFSGSATIDVVYSNNAKEQPGSVSAYKIFPEQDTKITDTLKAGSGTLTFHVPTSWPQRITFSAAGKDYQMMLLPGSHLTCQIDFGKADY
jgi:hypothetical protein